MEYIIEDAGIKYDEIDKLTIKDIDNLGELEDMENIKMILLSDKKEIPPEFIYKILKKLRFVPITLHSPYVIEITISYINLGEIYKIAEENDINAYFLITILKFIKSEGMTFKEFLSEIGKEKE